MQKQTFQKRRSSILGERKILFFAIVLERKSS